MKRASDTLKPVSIAEFVMVRIFLTIYYGHPLAFQNSARTLNSNYIISDIYLLNLHYTIPRAFLNALVKRRIHGHHFEGQLFFIK